MKRSEILKQADEIVNGERQRQYGDAEDSFGLIGALWSGYLGREVSPKDVALMMILLKVAREKSGGGKADNWVDIAGYAACGGEIGTEDNAAGVRSKIKNAVEKAIHEGVMNLNREINDGMARDVLIASAFLDDRKAVEEWMRKCREGARCTGCAGKDENMDIYTAQEEAYKRGKEAGERGAMVWVPGSDISHGANNILIQTRSGGIYMIEAQFAGMTGSVARTFPGEIVAWCEIRPFEAD